MKYMNDTDLYCPKRYGIGAVSLSIVYPRLQFALSLMDSLVNTKEDVDLLVKEIISNNVG
ncbi:hypothetical protein CUMW_247650 [Citrus unshiu]|uniref:Uncharacterized protein n=1 Tax=Citrus unshiu TaxID=55188 RepID=A0A2H5QNV7_CITUN|nr:hypothetical protein CUMW_247650 [Citrus unshiu]